MRNTHTAQHKKLRQLYARSSAQRGRSDDGNAFIPDPGDGPAHAPDELAEELAQEFLQAATSGEDAGTEARAVEVTEERGGPFVESTAGEEFAWTRPPGRRHARREPFPTSGRSH